MKNGYKQPGNRQREVARGWGLEAVDDRCEFYVSTKEYNFFSSRRLLLAAIARNYGTH